MRVLVLIFICLLAACAPAALTPNEVTNKNPGEVARVVITSGNWTVTDRYAATYFDISIKDLNRLEQRKKKLKLLAVNAPPGWDVNLSDISLYRETLSNSGSNSTFVDYVDISFAVGVPEGFEGLAKIEALVAFGDGPEREVVLLLGSEQDYLDMIDAPPVLVG